MKSSKDIPIQLSELSLFQQILLLTDGTLTRILETYVHEEIRVVKITETRQSLNQAVDVLHLNPGEIVVDRKILLQGWQSRCNWLYAESLLVPYRLPAKFQEQLFTTQEPIGKLWFTHKIETFKEIINTYREPAGRLSSYFDLDPGDLLLCRMYRVLSQRQPIMLITEKFPASYYVTLETNGRLHLPQAKPEPVIAGR